MNASAISNSFTRVMLADESGTACDLLARHTGLSKGRIKDCMLKGGVWHKRPGRKSARLRRASTVITSGQTLEINYDHHLLALQPQLPECLEKTVWYSVWNKPAGVLAQGTRFADHCALTRLAKEILGLRTEPHPVHRLDREARGLMLMAHDSKSAAVLSALFRSAQVEKEYQVIVRGIPEWRDKESAQPLDGKPSLSSFTVIQTDMPSNTTLLSARIATGRTHQVRRHLAGLGFPVLGDTRHGSARNHNPGLQLLAIRLALTCPFTNTHRQWTLPKLSFPLPT